MARRVLGRPYLVETGVTASLKGFARSTGLAGKKMIHLIIEEGVPHLFTPEVCGPKIGTVRTEWFCSTVEKDGTQGRSGGIAEIAGLPQEVQDRYRLTKADLVCVIIAAVGYTREYPVELW